MAASGFVNEKHGYTTAVALMGDVIADMLANGFVQKFPAVADHPFDATQLKSPYVITMEATKTVDPLNDPAGTNPQPWRVQFNIMGDQQVFMYVGTPTQLPDDGSCAVLNYVDATGTTYYWDVAGAIGAQIGTQDASGVAILTSAGVYKNTAKTDEATKGFINRPIRMGTLPNVAAAYPLAYRLVITNRGMWLGCWEDSTTTSFGVNFNWALIQRPVDRTTGATLVDGKAPVFCVNSVGGLYWQFVVRENDILKPSARRSASSNTTDSEAILNIQNQVSLSEDGKYIVTFPSRLNTARYRYPHELDMMGVTSADVVSQFSDVPLQFYGESSSRTYKALQANGTGNTGMRVLVLSNGGGISAS